MPYSRRDAGGGDAAAEAPKAGRNNSHLLAALAHPLAHRAKCAFKPARSEGDPQPLPPDLPRGSAGLWASAFAGGRQSHEVTPGEARGRSCARPARSPARAGGQGEGSRADDQRTAPVDGSPDQHPARRGAEAAPEALGRPPQGPGRGQGGGSRADR